ncbi:hypothetical protein V8F20_001613 [Naviculisporaceae sp. PSN 640]
MFMVADMNKRASDFAGHLVLTESRFSTHQPQLRECHELNTAERKLVPMWWIAARKTHGSLSVPRFPSRSALSRTRAELQDSLRGTRLHPCRLSMRRVQIYRGGFGQSRREPFNVNPSVSWSLPVDWLAFVETFSTFCSHRFSVPTTIEFFSSGCMPDCLFCRYRKSHSGYRLPVVHLGYEHFLSSKLGKFVSGVIVSTLNDSQAHISLSLYAHGCTSDHRDG